MEFKINFARFNWWVSWRSKVVIIKLSDDLDPVSLSLIVWIENSQLRFDAALVDDMQSGSSFFFSADLPLFRKL